MSLNCSGIEIGPHPTGLLTTPGVWKSGLSSSSVVNILNDNLLFSHLGISQYQLYFGYIKHDSCTFLLHGILAFSPASLRDDQRSSNETKQ